MQAQVDPGGAHANHHQDQTCLERPQQQQRFHPEPDQVHKNPSFDYRQERVAAGEAKVGWQGLKKSIIRPGPVNNYL